MKGITRTAAEVQLHDRIAALGCICCRIDGVINTWVSIHHCNGRTKPGCHEDVLPLCEAHHQNPPPGYLAIHGNKRQWQIRYGKEIDLVEKIMREIGHPYVRPEFREKPVRRPARKTKPSASEPGTAKPKARTSASKDAPTTDKNRLVNKRPKPAQTAAQIQYGIEQKAKMKLMQTQRREEYVAANADKIEEAKTRARDYQKAQRQQIAADKKAAAKKAKQKNRRAA